MKRCMLVASYTKPEISAESIDCPDGHIPDGHLYMALDKKTLLNLWVI